MDTLEDTKPPLSGKAKRKARKGKTTKEESTQEQGDTTAGEETGEMNLQEPEQVVPSGSDASPLTALGNKGKQKVTKNSGGEVQDTYRLSVMGEASDLLASESESADPASTAIYRQPPSRSSIEVSSAAAASRAAQTEGEATGSKQGGNSAQGGLNIYVKSIQFSLTVISAGKSKTKAEKEKEKARKKEEKEKARKKQQNKDRTNTKPNGKPWFFFSNSPLTPFQASSKTNKGRDVYDNSTDNEEPELLNLDNGQDDPPESKHAAPQENAAANTPDSKAADSVPLASGKSSNISSSHEADLVTKLQRQTISTPKRLVLLAGRTRIQICLPRFNTSRRHLPQARLPW
jgi:hypothetical protein